MVVVSPSQFSETSSQETNGRRPKLLFLAYQFPPLSAVACIRTFNIAKHLTRLGWNVTVVTPDSSIWRHTDNPEETDRRLAKEGIRRILTDYQWRILAPTHLKCRNEGVGRVVGGAFRKIARYLEIDSAIGWINAAEKACSRLTPDDVDVILATAPPFSAFILAKKLSDRLKRPYVFDYRDLWSRNAHDPMPGATRKEADLLSGCAAVTTVSPFWGAVMNHQFAVGSKLHVVSNGFDPEELQHINAHNFGHFAIVYAGNFYPPKRVISPVMAALKLLKSKTNNIQWYFHYYGNHENHVREEAARFDVADRTVIHGRVSWAESLSATKGAGVAVVVTSVEENDNPEDKGIVTGKIFEILGLGTRFLLIGPAESDAAAIASNTGLGRRFSGKDTDGIAAFLTDAMRVEASNPQYLDYYSWGAIAKRLDLILRQVRTTSFNEDNRV